MALSSVTYTGNGSTTSFAIPFPYLFQSDVSATVNGVTAAFTWTNPALIHFATAPATGTSVFIVRKTNITTLDVVFVDGSTVQASDINTAELQSLYLAQESNDGVSVAVAAAATATAATGAANTAAAAANAAVASLVPFTGDTGTGGVRGLVPAPPAGSAAAGKLLGAGGSWVVPPSSSPSTILYTAPFTGATSQTLLNRLGRTMFIEDFGGGIGATGSVNTAALNAALTSLGTGSGAIIFGAGTYTFSAASTFTYTGAIAQGVSLLGQGANVTNLLWPASNGLVFNMTLTAHLFHLRDLTLLTSSTPAAGFTALTVNQSQQGGLVMNNDISRCVFSGDDPSTVTHSWATSAALVGVANFTIDTVVFCGTGSGTGTGLTFNGVPASSGFKFAILLNVINTQFMNLAFGLVLGVQWQGVFITNCNFTNGNIGIHVNSGDPSNALGQLLATNCQFGTAGAGVFVESPVYDVTVMGSLFIINNSQAGIQQTISCGGSIIGNSFIASATAHAGQNGIVIGPLSTVNSPGPTMISGNTFFNLSTGVNLQTSSAGVNVQSNAYKSCTTSVANAPPTGNTVGGGSS